LEADNQAFEEDVRREGFGEIESGEKPVNYRTSERCRSAGRSVRESLTIGDVRLVHVPG
jgi:hypothetical protein